jgi:hypothetical protein
MTSIPAMCLFDKEGKLVTTNARGDLSWSPIDELWLGGGKNCLVIARRREMIG